jgi:hypothetical protein
MRWCISFFVVFGCKEFQHEHKQIRDEAIPKINRDVIPIPKTFTRLNI